MRYSRCSPHGSALDALTRTGTLALAALLLALLPQSADAGRRRSGNTPHEVVGFQLFASPQANPIAVSPAGDRVYVANTTSNRVDVIDTASNLVIARIEVGIDPVAVAVRPDGNEVWVSNHVSDSVNVIDTAGGSASLYEVVETIQDVGGDLVTSFDEPVGIAFASNSKAYVALSSTNQVAVVDATTYTVTATLDITAQDPRALTVRNGLLYVAAFESGNQSELSACPNGGPPSQCTLDAADLGIGGFATNPNLPGETKNIVIDPDVPDRDLFVFDTSDDSLVEAVSDVGTLLYGVAVDSGGVAYVTQTEARNAENGSEGDNLIDLDNRIFLNQIATVSCNSNSCGNPSVIELEPLPPAQPADGDQLATPYGVQISGDDATLVATAAASSRLFTLDAGTGNVLDILDVGAIPRGVALVSNAGSGAPETAYVLNTLDNSVTVVDVSNPSNLSTITTVAVGDDPTANPVRLGRIAFNDASASSSGTFSCASCHPDGNTDQLLWRIGGACFFGACSGDDEPRSTMPVRGLASTLPLHWDGTLGDPFGGPNGAVGTGGSSPANCSDDASCFLQLVDASLSGVMCDQSDGCAGGGELGGAERANMASFLASVSYPPPRRRPGNDALSAAAMNGFSDFFVDQGGLGGAAALATCADISGGCHTLPLGTATNSPVVGAFDAPTMRGMTDRFLQFSLGIAGPEEVLADSGTGWNPAEGMDEFVSFSSAFPDVFTPVYNVGPEDIFEMFEEASTGYSGAVGRQLTLNTVTTSGGQAATTQAILAALEDADARGLVNLRGVGLRNGIRIELSRRADGFYRNAFGTQFDSAQLLSEAQNGTLLLTLTADLRANVGDLGQNPQPLLASGGSGTLGDSIPAVVPAGPQVAPTLTGIDVDGSATVFVDGQPVSNASLNCVGGTFSPTCTSQSVQIVLPSGLAGGLHLVQVQNPRGLLSNELPLCAGNAGLCD